MSTPNATTPTLSAGEPIRSRVVARRRDSAEIFLYLLWGLLLFQPEWYLSQFGGRGVLTRIPTLLLPFLILFAAQRWRREALYWPFIIYLLLHFIHVPFAENRGMIVAQIKNIYPSFFLFVGTICIFRTPAQVRRLLVMYMFSFLWYGLQGLRSGYVDWATALSNPDSYGPLMGMGVGYAYYMASATRFASLRRFGYATAAVCLAGVISALARGAVLAAVLVLFVIWIRSPKKLRTIAAGVPATVVGILTISVLLPGGTFMNEMATISEGKDAGTGQERWIMWGIGWELFKRHPVIGVGPNHTGVVAYRQIKFDANRARYEDPSMLYNQTLHNIYLQLIAELGVVGATVYAMMIVGFFLRLRLARRPERRRMWARSPPGPLDIASVSYGLECAMVAYLANGFVYNQLHVNWFWTLITIGFAISIAREGPTPASRRRAGSPTPPSTPAGEAAPKDGPALKREAVCATLPSLAGPMQR